MERRGHGLFEGTTSAYAWRDRGKAVNRMSAPGLESKPEHFADHSVMLFSEPL